jgi:hypothetical protein
MHTTGGYSAINSALSECSASSAIYLAIPSAPSASAIYSLGTLGISLLSSYKKKCVASSASSTFYSAISSNHFTMAEVNYRTPLRRLQFTKGWRIERDRWER